MAHTSDPTGSGPSTTCPSGARTIATCALLPEMGPRHTNAAPAAIGQAWSSASADQATSDTSVRVHAARPLASIRSATMACAATTSPTPITSPPDTRAPAMGAEKIAGAAPVVLRTPAASWVTPTPALLPSGAPSAAAPRRRAAGARSSAAGEAHHDDRPPARHRGNATTRRNPAHSPRSRLRNVERGMPAARAACVTLPRCSFRRARASLG